MFERKKLEAVDHKNVVGSRKHQHCNICDKVFKTIESLFKIVVQ